MLKLVLFVLPLEQLSVRIRTFPYLLQKGKILRLKPFLLNLPRYHKDQNFFYQFLLYHELKKNQLEHDYFFSKFRYKFFKNKTIEIFPYIKNENIIKNLNISKLSKRNYLIIRKKYNLRITQIYKKKYLHFVNIFKKMLK